MNRQLIGGVLVVVAVLAGIFTWLFFRSGLREYVRVLQIIRLLPEEQRQETIDNLYNSHTAENNVYWGIFAGAFHNRLWLWTDNGLKSFLVDGGTVYSFFSACRPEILALIEDGAEFKVDRSVTPDLAEWLSWIRPGRFVTILVEDGKKRGNVREAYGYDWLAFLPVNDLERECAD